MSGAEDWREELRRKGLSEDDINYIKMVACILTEMITGGTPRQCEPDEWSPEEDWEWDEDWEPEEDDWDPEEWDDGWEPEPEGDWEWEEA